MTVRELIAQLQQLPESAWVEFECLYPDESADGELQRSRIRVDDVDLDESGNVVLR